MENKLPSYPLELGSSGNIMRSIFEYANKRKAEIGEENVYDYSLGNPSVAPPKQLNDTLIDILSNEEKNTIHAYTSAQGDITNRKRLAASLNKRFNANVDENDIYFTVGAAASLTCVFNGLTIPNDEYILFAPFFGEYTIFIEASGGKVVICPPNYETFEPDLIAFEKSINKNTKAIVINSPNNPTGVIYSRETLQKIADILNKKQKEFNHPIFLISDEPYREIVFDNNEVPWIPSIYDNTIVCYSYSKSLSIPGERIGYILVSKKVFDRDNVFSSICGAARMLGFVNAPSIFQRVAALLDGTVADISVYETNRNILYAGLKRFGFECIKPMGAFYLLLKSPIEDANEFSLKARDFDLLIVPTDSFALPGYIRIAFCVSTDTIKASLRAFEKLAKEYNLI